MHRLHHFTLGLLWSWLISHRAGSEGDGHLDAVVPNLRDDDECRPARVRGNVVNVLQGSCCFQLLHINVLPLQYKQQRTVEPLFWRGSPSQLDNIILVFYARECNSLFKQAEPHPYFKFFMQIVTPQTSQAFWRTVFGKGQNSAWRWSLESALRCTLPSRAGHEQRHPPSSHLSAPL